MHETDAMLFIKPVLLGFLSRQFGYQEGKEPSRHEPHLKKIQAFIRDNESFWVKIKSLHIIKGIEYAETAIRTGRCAPASPEAFVDMILSRVQKIIEDIAENNKLEENIGNIGIPIPLPLFPRKK